jgi:hypothetical protein
MYATSFLVCQIEQSAKPAVYARASRRIVKSGLLKLRNRCGDSRSKLRTVDQMVS